MSGRRLLVIAAVTAAVLTTAGVVRLRADDGQGLSEADAEAIVADYLAALDREDYRTAAGFLPPDLDMIAASLADYCRAGCLAPTGIAVEAGDGRYVVVVTFGEPRGHPLQRSFEVGETDDGEPYVRGLPPAGPGTIPSSVGQKVHPESGCIAVLPALGAKAPGRSGHGRGKLGL